MLLRKALLLFGLVFTLSTGALTFSQVPAVYAQGCTAKASCSGDTCECSGSYCKSSCSGGTATCECI